MKTVIVIIDFNKGKSHLTTQQQVPILQYPQENDIVWVLGDGDVHGQVYQRVQ